MIHKYSKFDFMCSVNYLVGDEKFQILQIPEAQFTVDSICEFVGREFLLGNIPIEKLESTEWHIIRETSKNLWERSGCHELY